ncbi:MAG TPA: hypothetical protein VIV60_30260 [Polyangiaceae bacterium]
MRNTLYAGTLERQSCKQLAFWGWFVVATTGCDRQTNREHAANNPAPSVAPSPQLTALSLSLSRLEIGTLLPNQPVERTLELSNTSVRSVRFRESSTSSRCQWVQPLTELPLGAKVPRTVRCQSDLQGSLKEQLTLTDERPNVPPTVLEITATVVPLVAFEPSFVDLRPEFGQTVHADITVIGTKVKDAKLNLEPTSSSVVSVTALPVKNGVPPRFRLTCRADRVGMHAGSVVAHTGLPEPADISVSWGCRVPGTLEVYPSNPYFNLKVSGEKAVTIEVRSRQPGFEIRSVRIKEGPFTASAKPRNPDGSYSVEISVVNHEIPDEARSASGMLVIESNDLREPHKEVPLFGFGQINKVQHP